MLGDLIHPLNKLYGIPAAGITVAAKTGPGVGWRVNLQTGRFILVKRAKQAVVLICSQSIIGQYCFYGKMAFDFWDVHS